MVTPPRGGQYHDDIMVLIKSQNSLTLTKSIFETKKISWQHHDHPPSGIEGVTVALLIPPALLVTKPFEKQANNRNETC
eukprot:UN21415